MKTLINLCKMLPILILVLGSCKTKSPDPENVQITEKDLADYYLVAEHKTGGNKLLVLHFNEDGNVVKANGHLQAALRIQDVSLQNSTFTFDYNSDGKSVYTFTFERNADGNLTLKAYDFVYNGEANQLSFAVTAKKAEAFEFDNTSFKIAAERIRLLKEGNDESLWWFGANHGLYKLDNVGFKTNDHQFMGVAVPSWRGGTPVMLIEEGDKVWVAVQE